MIKAMHELTVIRGDDRTVLSFYPGQIAKEVLLQNGLSFQSPCGGQGLCGKCAAWISGMISAPSAVEKRFESRLLCQVKLLGDAQVILPADKGMREIAFGEDEAFIPENPMEGLYGVCVDIGTTTLALRLIDLSSGRCIAKAGRLNPQTSVAADVMGRIAAALEGKLELLKEQIGDAMGNMLHDACVQASVSTDSAASFVVTGNTTMLYLFTGKMPDSLAHAPFEADTLFGIRFAWKGKHVYLPACAHAFVGADITCAILSCGLTEHSEPALLCDIGTNGEIALWNGNSLYVTSTAAGPAFEGAGISCGCGSVPGAIDRVWAEGGRIQCHTVEEQRAIGICGSGLIDAVAVGLDCGMIDETGAMDTESFPLSEAVALSRKDIRSVQLAKAALAAGMETMLKEADVAFDQISVLYIAGGFGAHLNVNSAARIGLIPSALVPKVQIIGNAALTGAFMLLTDQSLTLKTDRIAAAARHVQLGGDPYFNERYMEQMLFLKE